MKKPLISECYIEITADNVIPSLGQLNKLDALYECLEEGAYYLITPIMKMSDGKVIVGNQRLERCPD